MCRHTCKHTLPWPNSLVHIGRLYSCLASERAVPKKSLRRLTNSISFWEREAGNRSVARGKRMGPNSGLMLLVAPVLHSRMSCVAPAALAFAEFVDAYRPALQLLGLRAGNPKEEPATLDEEVFSPADFRLCAHRKKISSSSIASSSLGLPALRPSSCRAGRYAPTNSAKARAARATQLRRECSTGATRSINPELGPIRLPLATVDFQLLRTQKENLFIKRSRLFLGTARSEAKQL